MAPQPEHARARRAYGQNFLTDPHAVRAIVAAAEIKPDAMVYEVVAGCGRLTAAMSAADAQVVA